jgi:hypothetical protein
LLSEWQRSLDFKSLGIASECNKRIRAAGPSTNCHGILIILNHVTWTYYERRWHNDPFVQWQQRSCHLQRWRFEGLDKDPNKVFFIQA